MAAGTAMATWAVGTSETSTLWCGTSAGAGALVAMSGRSMADVGEPAAVSLVRRGLALAIGGRTARVVLRAVRGHQAQGRAGVPVHAEVANEPMCSLLAAVGEDQMRIVTLCGADCRRLVSLARRAQLRADIRA